MSQWSKVAGARPGAMVIEPTTQREVMQPQPSPSLPPVVENIETTHNDRPDQPISSGWFDLLSGWKTVVVGAVCILVSVAELAGVQIPDAVYTLLLGAGGITLRLALRRMGL